METFLAKFTIYQIRTLREDKRRFFKIYSGEQNSEQLYDKISGTLPALHFNCNFFCQMQECMNIGIGWADGPPLQATPPFRAQQWPCHMNWRGRYWLTCMEWKYWNRNEGCFISFTYSISYLVLNSDIHLEAGITGPEIIIRTGASILKCLMCI